MQPDRERERERGRVRSLLLNCIMWSACCYIGWTAVQEDGLFAVHFLRVFL